MTKVAVVLCNDMHMDIRNANALLNCIRQNVSYEIVCDYTMADYVIIMTCAFGPNKMRSVRIIADVNRNSREGARVVVTGCLLKINLEELEAIPGIEAKEFYELISEFGSSDSTKSLSSTLPQNKVIISEGCLHNCSYCVYPMIANKYKSRPMEEIIKEVGELYKTESIIYITGAQETSDYGVELYGKRCFATLLEKIVTQFPDCDYVIGWFNPAGLTDEVISVISKYPNIMEIMLHIQHVDEKILKTMKRPTFKETDEKIRKLKNLRPELRISTEVIVGFPGEGENEYKKLIQYLSKKYFCDIGVASFEPVIGTKAARLEQQVEAKTKSQRMKNIQTIFDATCYPADEESGKSVIEVYRTAYRQVSKLPKKILLNTQKHNFIAGVDTNAKFEELERHILEVYERVIDSRTRYNLTINRKYFDETYTKEAKEMFYQIINASNCKKPIKDRAYKLLR